MSAATTPLHAPLPSTTTFWLRFGLAWVALPLFFLLTGGALDWWAAWAWCAVVLVPMTVFAAHRIRTDPESLAWRMQYREKEAAQRKVLSWSGPLVVALFVLPGLDHRFGWSRVPPAVMWTALAVSAAAYLGVLWVFIANRWASRTVETRPGQQVISTGPYAVVRHPMYAAALLLYVATPLALGSAWGVLPALGMVPVFVARLKDEERVLRGGLPGYEAYCAKVRWRLLPGVW